MNSNLRPKFLTGAMVLLVTVFVIPGFAGAFTQSQCRNEKQFAKLKMFRLHHPAQYGKIDKNGKHRGAYFEN